MENRIIIDPKILLGKPVIRGTRIPVYLILNLLAGNKTIKEILKEYPELTEQGVRTAINYSVMNLC